MLSTFSSVPRQKSNEIILPNKKMALDMEGFLISLVQKIYSPFLWPIYVLEVGVMKWEIEFQLEVKFMCVL